MIKILTRNITRFVLLVLLQVFVFNNIQFSGYINPYIYILYILLLPFETPRWALLVLGFLLGMSIDLFVQTVGIHTSATVFLAFCRPYLLSMIAPRDGYDAGTFPRIYFFGLAWFFKYTLIMVLIHHFFLFYIEAFSFADFFVTLFRVLLSSLFSITLIILSQYFIYKK